MTPETCESQVDLQGNHLKRFADQFDREWELYSYNQHPVMLDYFRTANETKRRDQENEELRAEGKSPLDDQYT